MFGILQLGMGLLLEFSWRLEKPLDDMHEDKLGRYW